MPASVLRERIFNSDARNPYSVPQDQHPPFPFQYQDVGVAPAKAVVRAPSSSGSSRVGSAPTQHQREYNAVADAFGDAFGAPPAPAPAPAPAPVQQQVLPATPILYTYISIYIYIYIHTYMYVYVSLGIQPHAAPVRVQCRGRRFRGCFRRAPAPCACSCSGRPGLLPHPLPPTSPPRIPRAVLPPDCSPPPASFLPPPCPPPRSEEG